MTLPLLLIAAPPSTGASGAAGRLQYCCHARRDHALRVCRAALRAEAGGPGEEGRRSSHTHAAPARSGAVAPSLLVQQAAAGLPGGRRAPPDEHARGSSEHCRLPSPWRGRTLLCCLRARALASQDRAVAPTHQRDHVRALQRGAVHDVLAGALRQQQRQGEQFSRVPGRNSAAGQAGATARAPVVGRTSREAQGWEEERVGGRTPGGADLSAAGRVISGAWRTRRARAAAPLCSVATAACLRVVGLAVRAALVCLAAEAACRQRVAGVAARAAPPRLVAAAGRRGRPLRAARGASGHTAGPIFTGAGGARHARATRACVCWLARSPTRRS